MHVEIVQLLLQASIHVAKHDKHTWDHRHGRTVDSKVGVHIHHLLCHCLCLLSLDISHKQFLPPHNLYIITQDT